MLKANIQSQTGFPALLLLLFANMMMMMMMPPPTATVGSILNLETFPLARCRAVNAIYHRTVNSM